MTNAYRVPPLRFTIEQAPNGLWVLVDWALGIVAGPGIGRQGDAEQLLVWVREYVRHHGDINILRRPKTFRPAPRFPGGHRPAERHNWRAEQRAIVRAYARVAEIIRTHRLQDHQLSGDPDVLLAKKHADRLHAAALAAVGL